MWSGTTGIFPINVPVVLIPVYYHEGHMVQTYFMMDKSPGIIMVMISCRTQRHQLVEKLFREDYVSTMMDKRVKNYKHERHHMTHMQMNNIFTYAYRYIYKPFLSSLPSRIVYIPVLK